MQKNMQKKIALIFYFFVFLILFRGCQVIFDRVIDYLFEVPDPEQEYCYEAFWYFQGDGTDAGEGAPDEYYFLLNDTIYQYSVAAQELTQLYQYENDSIDHYAVNDDYIFFMTGRSGRQGTPVKLWKYDRTADICELFTELPQDNYSLAVYGSYLFYGDDDICVCPIDGNPREDSISLLAQFPEGVSAKEMRDVVYQGWRIRRESTGSRDKIIFIKDEENANVIWTLATSWDGVWLDMNGELIRFTKRGEDSYYQREDEQEKRSIDCLDDYYYGMSGVGFHKLAVEDGKIICLIPVSKHPNMIQGLTQNEVKKDILVEIDMEEGSDRIIYSTKDNKTRIIGYRGGTVYLLEDDIIYRESLEGRDREQVFDLRNGSVALYNSNGRHSSIDFIMWGDNLIVRSPYGTNGMFTLRMMTGTE